jgi:hypothetical protein
MSKLLEAIQEAVKESESFYGSFAFGRDDSGTQTGEVFISVADGQESGTPETGSGVLVLEKKSKIQVVKLTELVGKRTSMGVNYTLWKFVNETALLKK